MENFFIKAYEFEKTADKTLSKNHLQWPNEVLESLYSSFPELANLPQSINYVSKNDDKGDALGQINVADAMLIPFVIDSGKLKSLTVYYQPDQTITQSMPLTKTAVNDMFFKQTSYKGLTRRSARPYLDNYVSSIGTQMKTASFIEGLEGRVCEEDKTELLKTLTDKKILAKLAELNNPIISKIENLSTPIEKKASPDLEEDISYTYKSAGLGWTKISGNSKVYSPRVSFLREIDVDPKDQLIKTSNLEKPMEKIASVSGTIKYKNRDYEIIKLDQRLCKSAAILVASDNLYIDEFTKVAEWKFSPNQVNHKQENYINKGDLLLIKTADKEYAGPVFVNSAVMTNGSWRIDGNLGLEKIAFIEHNKISNTVYSKGIVYVPKTSFIKLASKVSPTQKIEKKASDKNMVAKRGNEFYVTGPDFEKYANLSGVKKPLTEQELTWTLVQLGATLPMIKKASSILNNHEITIQDPLTVPASKIEFEKTSSTSSKELREFVKSNFRGMIKEAVATGNPETLDVILGLNLINEDSMDFLINNIPTIDATLNLLSRLWLMSVTGMKSVDETAVKTIISKLSSIRDILASLATMLKK